MSTMEAYLIEGVEQHRIGTMPVPAPGEGEVCIRVMAAGLCGTDAHIYKGEYFGAYPIVPGHEFSGVVEQVGGGVHNFKPGDRVAADPNIFCENCPECKENRQNFCQNFDAAGVTVHGAMAQFVVIPEKCVFSIGDISFTHGALIEPLACVVHSQNQLALKLASRVLIVGAGAIGLMQLQVSRINGGGFVAVSDIRQDRLDLAKELGADAALLAGDVNAFVGAHGGFDVVIDCTGVPAAVEGAVSFVKNGGTLLIFGVCPDDSKISISPYEIFHRELTILGTFALRKTFGQAIQLVESGRILLDPLVGSKVLLQDFPQEMEAFVAGKSWMKTVVYPNGI